MPKLVTIEAGPRRRKSARWFPIDRVWQQDRWKNVNARQLPAVEPGQLWLVELPAEPASAPLEYRALGTANVTIYDRPLAATVARSLPLGGYAEPAADDAWERALRFAGDGWSVARLLVPGSLAEFAPTGQSSASGAVSVFVNSGAGAYRRTEASLAALRDVTAQAGAGFNALTVVVGAIDRAVAPHFSATAANGLAG